MAFTANRIFIFQGCMVLWLSACGGNNLTTFRPEQESASDRDSESTDADRDMEDPQNITGSYLTSSCGPALNEAPRFEKNMDAYIYGCQVHNQNREKYLGPVKNFKAQFELHNGEKVKPAFVIAADVREPWSFILAFDKAAVDAESTENRENDIKLIDLTFVAAKKVYHVQDSVLNYVPSISSANDPSEGSGSGLALTMFVSSKKYDGNLGGISGANRKCNDLAKAVQLDGEFMAVLSGVGIPVVTAGSGDYNIVEEIKRKGTVNNIRGEKIADNVQALFLSGPILSLDKSVNITEKNSKITQNETAWTGTFARGTANGLDCKVWTSSTNDINLKGSVGQITSKTSDWIDYKLMGATQTTKCKEEHRIYCISK